MLKRLLGILLITIPASLFAQEKWDLRRCVEYALQNNISVKTADIQARITALDFKQAKLNRYPTASFNANVGEQFGRSIDPTTNQFTTSKFFFNQFQLQGGAQIYNWGRLQHAQAAANFNAQAALMDVEKARNDVALNVATYYLGVLSSNEQVKIMTAQIGLTKAKLDVTQKKVDAGALPELNLAELQAQLATDSTNFITAKTTLEQNTLSLKGLLNIDMASPFEVAMPPVETIPLDPISELQPGLVYQLALNTQPAQKANELYLKGAAESVKSLRALMYPSLTGFYGLSSTYNNQAFGVVGISSVTIPVGKVNIGGVDYDVVSTQPIAQYGKTKYFKQIDQNFSQNIGIGLSIPIFNNGTSKIGYERAKLQYQSIQIQKAQIDQTLQSSIYSAFANAVAALEKFNASNVSVASAQKAYDFASKRYEVGLLTTIDLITNQNNLLTAKLQQLANQYDYVFKMKVLEFYKGQGIKL